MRKGLKSTLMTVAVALLGYQAMAKAPVISNIPDVIIGDADTATPANTFVFPDAINANAKVTDDSTSVSAIAWSFSNTGGHYSINGRTRNDGVSGFNYANPGTNYSLDGGDDPLSTDTNKRTWTFRNTFYSPINGTNVDPGTATDSQVITVYACDGETTSLKSFTASIDNGGTDKLSGSTGGVTVADVTFNGSTNGWVTETVAGTTPPTFSTAGGLCMSVPAAGDNMGDWASQPGSTTYSWLTLVNNAIYRIHSSVTLSGSAPGSTPAIFMALDNTQLLFNGSQLVFDSGTAGVSAGANSIGTMGSFDFWCGNPAVKVSALTSYLFDPAQDGYTKKDMSIRFVVMDLGASDSSTHGYGAAQDYGQVCLTHVSVDRYDFDSASVLSTQTFNPTNGTSTLNYVSSSNATATWGTNQVTINPTSATVWTDASGAAPYMEYYPGSSQSMPIDWVSNKLYRIGFTLTTSNGGGGVNGQPMDFLLLNAGTATNELNQQCALSNMFHGKAWPNAGTDATYYIFWYSHNRSLSTGLEKWTPYLAFGCNSTFTDTANTQGIVIKGITVEEVQF